MSGQRLIEADDEKQLNNGVSQCGAKGSATVEAAIVLPIFLIALFSLAYVIRIFFAYSTMQSALQKVARDMSSASYFYYVSGIKGLSEKLDNMGQESSDELNGQKETIVNTVDSFNSLIASANPDFVSNQTGLDGKIDQISQMYYKGKEFTGNAKAAMDLVKEIIKDPKAEGKLILTIFAQKAAYTARKELVCLVAGCMLDSELQKKAILGADARRMLGIDNISFSQSQIFGDQESLEFIITYTVRPPGIFGLVPKMTLSNRVKLIAWTGGRGQSVRVNAADEKPAAGSSVWNQMDNEKNYFERGLEIEKQELAKLQSNAQNAGISFMATEGMFPRVDAFIYDGGMVEAYDVFTLNPFMKSYESQPGKFKSEIVEHGKRLMEFDFGDYPEDVPQSPDKKRIVICVVPENAPDIGEYFEAAKAELLKLGITDVRLVKGYGNYTKPGEDEQNGST